MIILNEIEISPLLKAQAKFEQFRLSIATEQEQAGLIQAFEYCYELCWKTLKRVLAVKGLQVAAPCDAFREGAKLGLLDDPELWFEFIQKRNLTSHTYNEKYMLEVLEIIPAFSNAMADFIHHVRTLV